MSKESENTGENNESKGFDLPKDYFNDFSASVLNKIEWIKEHKEFPLLEKMKEKHGFIVPENYFEKLEVKQELLLYPLLSSTIKQNNFEVPSSYFEELDASLNAGNEEKVFPILDGIQKINAFTVPENYFHVTAEKIESQLSTKTKVINLFSVKTWTVSAAAILVITLGFWLFSSYFSPAEKDCGSLACIDKSELLKNKNLENVENDELYEVVDTKKLEENLNKKPSENKKTNDSSDQISTDDLPDEI